MIGVHGWHFKPYAETAKSVIEDRTILNKYTVLYFWDEVRYEFRNVTVYV